MPLTEPAAIRRRVSYVSTTGWMGLEWALTAEENVRFFATLSGLSGHKARERTEEALRDTDLWEDRGKRTSELSNGMRQRLILARGLVLRTPLVLLDEPTVGLDPVTRDEVLDRIFTNLPARGQTVLVADHQVGAVSSRMDHAAILSGGSVVAIGTPSALVQGLRNLKVLELMVAGAEALPQPPLACVRAWDARMRPGPLALAQVRLMVEDRPDSLRSVLDYVMRQGGQIEGVTERPPGLEDLLETGALDGPPAGSIGPGNRSTS